MATDKIIIPVETETNGTIDRDIKKAENLRKSLEGAAKAASGAGGTAGSRALAAGMPGGMTGEEYRKAQGVSGVAGSGARDFAKEAQGLGGLVRLYATYAANVFAVSAAFRALSEAMNTTNMIQGLDQLGAATGVAMGGLAKRFAEVSGGAISLRESLEATAKAVSSGLTQKQFMQLGEVARKASQALGVNMSDAVSRLTRGISKLEPELLDELGLFTKVGKATEDYARRVGKTAESLTDFERRQAFANAVLKEGLDKFSDIDIPTNPYDKLLASLKNVTQGILETVNKGLVPLVDFLSKSPTALTGVIAGLGILILKQALPIFSSYRAAMQKATEESEKMAEAKAATARRALEITKKARAAEATIELEAIAARKTAQVDAAEDALKAVSKRGLSKQVQGILAKPDLFSITDKDLALLDKLGDKNTKVSAQYKALAASIREAQRANNEYLTGVKAINEKAEAAPGFFTAAAARQRELEAASRQKAGATIVKGVGETVSTVGTIAASKELLDGLRTEKLGLFRGGLTAISGAATILAGTLTNLLSVFSKFLGYIGIALTVFELLDFAFSKNGKEVAAFNDAMNMSEEAVKAATNTYKKFSEQLSTQNIIASAQALNTLKDNIQDTYKALREAEKASSAWDRLVNGIKTLWGGDLQTRFAENFAKQIEAGLKTISDPKLQQDAKKRLTELLGVKDFSKEALAAISPSKLIANAEQINKLFDTISEQATKSAGNLTSVADGFKALELSYTELSNQLIQRDPLSKFGADLAQQGFKLAEVFKDPVAGAAQLREILSDVSKLKLLSPDSQRILVENRAAFVDLSNQLQIYEKQIAASQKALDEIASRGMNFRKRARLVGEETTRLDTARTRASEIRAQMEDIGQAMTNAINASILKGFSIVQSGFENVLKQQVLASQKALLDMLPKTPETAALSAQLENRKLELQKQQINQTERLIKEMELSRLSAERIQIERQRDEQLRTATSDTVREDIQRRAQEQLAPITKRESVLKSTNISRDIAAGKLERTPETLVEMQRQMGTLSKIAELSNQQQMNIMRAQVEAVNARYEAERRDVQEKLKSAAALEQQYKASEEFRSFTLEQQQGIIEGYRAEEAVLNRQLATLDTRREREVASTIQLLAQSKGWTEIAAVAAKSETTAKEYNKRVSESFDTTTKAAKAERDRSNTLAVSAQQYALLSVELDKQSKLTQLSNQTTNTLLELEKERLTQQVEQGKISIDSYNKQVRALEGVQLQKQADQRLTELLNSYLKESASIEQQYAGAVDASAKALKESKLAALEETYNAEVSGVYRVLRAQKDLRASQENLTQRQKSYDEFFKNSFNSMADAIVEFAQTGKFSFKDMVNTMLAEILRLELRMQAANLYMASRSALLNFVPSLLGGTPATASTAGTTDYSLSAAGVKLNANAKGGVYGSGIQQFAKGGTFTNSLVNSPTVFKFAKGIGVMGEAGPEAIMPLKRDANGNLGVRAQDSGKVDVVVNNYSNAQATTQETTDSRGNRKIEVIIGEAAASEMGRSGSQSQKTMRGTFGLTPQLIRR